MRDTHWYRNYRDENIERVKECLAKCNIRGRQQLREKPSGSFWAWFGDAKQSAEQQADTVVEIVLIGVNPSSLANEATIKEFQALHEDCLHAQINGDISENAELIFVRVSQKALAEEIEFHKDRGRCVIVASCAEEQRSAVRKVYEEQLAGTIHNETMHFTPLKRDKPKFLPPESSRIAQVEDDRPLCTLTNNLRLFLPPRIESCPAPQKSVSELMPRSHSWLWCSSALTPRSKNKTRDEMISPR